MDALPTIVGGFHRLEATRAVRCAVRKRIDHVARLRAGRAERGRQPVGDPDRFGGGATSKKSLSVDGCQGVPRLCQPLIACAAGVIGVPHIFPSSDPLSLNRTHRVSAPANGNNDRFPGLVRSEGGRPLRSTATGQSGISPQAPYMWAPPAVEIDSIPSQGAVSRVPRSTGQPAEMLTNGRRERASAQRVQTAFRQQSATTTEVQSA